MKNKAILLKLDNINKEQIQILKDLNNEVSNDSDLHSLLRSKNLIDRYLELEIKKRYINKYNNMKYLIGIQPTGKLHIGNYLGCIKKGLEYQSQGNEVVFLLANYHSMTTSGEEEITHQELIKLGCLNIVRQNPEVLELFFKLCCQMNLGTLLKMPQYKDKKDSVKFDLGLLLYPVLMAADIIYHNPDVILIGKDQIPHIELCNDICHRIGVNKTFQYELSEIDKVMSLINPDKKMSKSLGEKHVLYLFDEDYDVKLKKAITTPDGIENLLNIASGLDITNEPQSNQNLKELIANEMNRFKI